jgi:hypothetical protein
MKELLVRVISKKRSNANRGQRPRVETHSLPTLTRSYPRRFTFHVADPHQLRSDLAGDTPAATAADFMHRKRQLANEREVI